jgi:hypothetical protein
MSHIDFCEAPLCDGLARWFVGFRLMEDLGRGHFCCDEHIAECARVTIAQLKVEQRPVEGVTLVPHAPVKVGGSNVEP